MQFTIAEAVLVEGIDRALDTGKLNRAGRSFTARQLATAV